MDEALDRDVRKFMNKADRARQLSLDLEDLLNAEVYQISNSLRSKTTEHFLKYDLVKECLDLGLQTLIYNKTTELKSLISEVS
jgi:hypothetical protein